MENTELKRTGEEELGASSWCRGKGLGIAVIVALAPPSSSTSSSSISDSDSSSSTRLLFLPMVCADLCRSRCSSFLLGLHSPQHQVHKLHVRLPCVAKRIRVDARPPQGGSAEFDTARVSPHMHFAEYITLGRSRITFGRNPQWWLDETRHKLWISQSGGQRQEMKRGGAGGGLPAIGPAAACSLVHGAAPADDAPSQRGLRPRRSLGSRGIRRRGWGGG